MDELKEMGRVRIEAVETLDRSWGTLSRYRLSYRRFDGRTQNQTRNVYDRGDAATILLRDPTRDVVLLTRQLRIPALVNGHVDGMLLEAPAGGLDGDDPAYAIRREVEEETGYRIGAPRALFSAFMSPGSMTERVHFFMADYSANQRVGAGGGLADEGEDIELIEMPLTEALAMIDSGAIVDAKTIMLLQRAALERADAKR